MKVRLTKTQLPRERHYRFAVSYFQNTMPALMKGSDNFKAHESDRLTNFKPGSLFAVTDQTGMTIFQCFIKVQDYGGCTIQELYPLCTVNMYAAWIHLTPGHNHMCTSLPTTQLLCFRMKSHCIDSEKPSHFSARSKKPSRASSTALR